MRAIGLIPSLTGFYPPLFQFVVAFFWLDIRQDRRNFTPGNLPAIAILLLATYGIGLRNCYLHFSAAMAAVLVSSYPLLLWLSRETIIDYWLTSMVALADVEHSSRPK